MPKFSDNSMKAYSLIKSDTKEECHVCGEHTEYIDYCYEVRLCSTECLHKMNNYYQDWLRSLVSK